MAVCSQTANPPNLIPRQYFRLYGIYVLYMYFICTIYVLYMFYICTLYVLYMYYICSIYVLYMYYICTIYVLYMYYICTLFGPFICDIPHLVLSVRNYWKLKNNYIYLKPRILPWEHILYYYIFLIEQLKNNWSEP